MIIVAPTTNYNGFTSVAVADSFHTDRQNVEWTGTTAVKEAAIIKATDFIKTRYEFDAEPVTDDFVEPMLIEATCALALYALKTDLFAIEDSKFITSQTSASGKNSISKTFSTKSVDRFPFVTALLSNLARLAPINTSNIRVGRLI